MSLKGSDKMSLIHLSRRTVREMDDYMRSQGYSANTKVSVWVTKALEQERALEEAVKIIRQGKAQFAPHTDNSDVDVFLGRYDSALNATKLEGDL